MTTKQLTKIEPSTLASELHFLETVIAEEEARAKKMREELLHILQSQHIKSVKLDTGDMYIVSERQTLKVKDQAKAEKWAEDNSCWKLDTTKILKIVRRELKLPKFFGIESKQYLTIKRAKGDEEGEN